MLTSNYIHTDLLDLDLPQIRFSCDLLMQTLVQNKEYYQRKEQPFYEDPNSPESTKMFGQYNLFTHPYGGFHSLYSAIREKFHSVCDWKTEYYIQCWMNYAEKGNYLDWHRHHDPEQKGWHGFYCVDVGDSKTTYKLPSGEEIDVISQDNLLVLSRSDGDKHRTYPWEGDKPRITIAFDIIPRMHVPYQWLDHWLPI